MTKTDYFWTDINQAAERLSGSVVMYDGHPVYITEVQSVDDDDIPRGRLVFCNDPKQDVHRKKLNSPKFNRFRELPKLGFINGKGGQLYHAQRRIRTTRTHGYSVENILVNNLTFAGGSHGFTSSGRISFSSGYWSDPGFHTQAQQGLFPSVSDLVQKLKKGTGAAFANEYAVVVDEQGYRWLYRHLEKIGIFVGMDKLLLPKDHFYLREELMNHKAFGPINQILEF